MSRIFHSRSSSSILPSCRLDRPGHSPPQPEEAVQEAAHVDRTVAAAADGSGRTRTATKTDLPAKVKTKFTAGEQLDGKN